MRLLGIRAGLPAFRWDLVYLHSNLVSDDRAEIQALAPAVLALLGEIRFERELIEAAEDQAVLGSARAVKRDGVLDAALLRFGGVARATDKDLYGTLFPRLNPSRIARLGMADEAQEMDRILGELAVLPAAHPLRVEYQAPLTAAVAALRQALGESSQAQVALAVARSRLERFKLRMDEARVEVHGRLLTILKDKAAADAFFRSTSKAPDAAEDEAEEPPAEEAAQAQA